MRPSPNSTLRRLALPLGVAAGVGSLALGAAFFVLRRLWTHEMAMVSIAFIAAGAVMLGVGVKNTLHPTARVSTQNTPLGFSKAHRAATWVDGVRTALLGLLFFLLAVTGDLLLGLVR